MNIKGPLKKFFTVAVWCLLGGAGLALLIAAINAKNGSMCSGLEVEINKGGKAFFLTPKDLFTLMQNEGLKDYQHKKTTSFNLLKLEAILRKNAWVREAEMYFDNNQILKIRVQEREPVARIFTLNGTSFYIDSSGTEMPLSEKNVFRLPVFTGYPSDKFGLRKDSAMNQQIRELASFLTSDPFWSKQIQAVNISASRTFWMTPLIGNQVIEFGDGNDYENKFHRLMVFYKAVITQTGFEKYTSIKLAFANQVVATRSVGFISKADSIQARRNVMEMIRQAQKMQSDSSRPRETKPLERNTLTEQNLRGYDLPEERDNKKDSGTKHQKQL